MMRLVDKNFLFSWFFTLVVCVSLNSCGGARSLTEGSSASSAYSDDNDISADNHEGASSLGLGSLELTSPTISTGSEDDDLSGGFDTSSVAPGSSDFSAQPTSLFIKRLDVEIEAEELTASFRSSILMQRDEFIQISASGEMGIEFLRLLLTPDSLSAINLREKRYFTSDYSSLQVKDSDALSFNDFQLSILDLVEFARDTPDIPYSLTLSHSRKETDARTDSESPTLQKVETDTSYDPLVSPLLTLIRILFPDHSDSLSVVLEIKKIEVNLEVKKNFRIPAKYKEVYSLSDI